MTLTAAPLGPGRPLSPGRPRGPYVGKQRKNQHIEPASNYYYFFFFLINRINKAMSLISSQTLTIGPGAPLSPGAPDSP